MRKFTKQIFIPSSVYLLQKRDQQRTSELITKTLSDLDVDLTTDQKKNEFAAQRLLMCTESVMEAAVRQYHNMHLVLGQIAEWGDMVNRFITHDKAFMTHDEELRGKWWYMYDPSACL